MSNEVKRYGPEEIYLQIHGDAMPDETIEVDYKSGEVTWCWDRIFDHDERYVHESALTERDRQWREKVEGLANELGEKAREIHRINGGGGGVHDEVCTINRLVDELYQLLEDK